MDDIKLTAGTLSGDIRDMILTHIRAMETPWSKLSEMQQRDKIFAADEAARSMVRGAIAIISTQGFPHVLATVGKWTVKDGVKLELITNSSVDNITRLAEHGSSSAVLVLTEASVFFGERAPAKADKDQPDLPMDGGDDVAHDPVTGEIPDEEVEAPPATESEIESVPSTTDDGESAPAEIAADADTRTVTRAGRRQRVTVEELQAELRAGKTKVHGIGDVEIVS